MSSVLDQTSELLELAPELVSVRTDSRAAVLLSVDIGTSGVRATLFDEFGSELSASSQQQSVATFSTLDADQTVELVVRAIDLLLYRSSDKKSIELIAISCFWHSLVGVDSGGRAITPVFTWADTRAADAARRLRARISDHDVHSRTGCRIHPCYWPAKLLWLKTEQPNIFQAAKYWLSFSEYLTLKLFGDTTISVSMASGTGLFNQKNCEWDRALLAELSIPEALLPVIGDHHTTGRTLKSEFRARWQDLDEARLCLTVADGAANNIGSGCHTREKLALMIGTSGAARILYSGEPPAEIPAELWSYRADRSRVVLGGALSDGGGVYAWLRELLLPLIESIELTELLDRVAPDSHGLTVLPFWAGERSTGWSLEARGCILGLTLQTTPVEVLRATMEAIAYRFALIVRALEGISPVKEVVASGNALQSSPAWLQIIADVLGRPVYLSNAREASSRGAALLALEAAGKIPSLELINEVPEIEIIPDTSRHAIYQKGLDRQQTVYKQLIDL